MCTSQKTLKRIGKMRGDDFLPRDTMPRVFLVLLLFVLTVVAPDSEARRLALVVGNDAYLNVSQLRNARSDAASTGTMPRLTWSG